MLNWGHHVLLDREFVNNQGLPNHLRLLLLQGLRPVYHLLTHVQLLGYLLHRLAQNHVVLLHLLLLRQLTHLLRAWLKFR